MCRVGPDVYVVSPFIENGDLLACLDSGKVLNRNKLLFEVAEALTHLHHRGIAHGDIKAQNILVSDDGSALLCDFGLAKAFEKAGRWRVTYIHLVSQLRRFSQVALRFTIFLRTSQ